MSFALCIFNRQGVCQYYHDWTRRDPAEQRVHDITEDFKLMFGLCWSLKGFATTVDPKSVERRQMGAPTRVGEGCSFRSFRTDTYKLHYLESPSGLKFMLTTVPNIRNLSDQLHYIYTNIFVECVVKNPLYNPGEPFMFEPFTLALNKYLVTLGLLT